MIIFLSVSDLYPDLSPPDYDNAGHIEPGQEPVTTPDNVSEEQKQEWREELEKVRICCVCHTFINDLIPK